MKGNDIDLNYINNAVLDKTYFTKSFMNKFIKENERFGYKILDHQENEFLLKDECTLGINHSGKRQLKALFLENQNRDFDKLIIQNFNSNDNPIKNAPKEVSFRGKEIERLYFFLKSIKEVSFPDGNTFNVKDEELKKMLLNDTQLNKLIQDNFELLQEALQNNVTSKDLINFGYRKAQLSIFDKLLNETGFFETYKQELIVLKELKTDSGKEAVWQKFFEKNTWILGYGLDYIFNSELDDKKLEQVTTGADFQGAGKRIDGLLKSKGAINSLCFCELKLSTDSLLKQLKVPYRSEAWQISDALSGAIAQVQRTIQKAIKGIDTKTSIKDKEGYLTGEELYLYNPKGFIIIGKQDEFINDKGINEIKYSSFEMFRKNLKNIDIITYDELYQRAYYICNKK
ncbi:DUF4263 domain-containing protein [Flavobacterium psychrophilum]